MIITREFEGIEYFEAWSGGDDTKKDIIAANKSSLFDDMLYDWFPKGCTETELNDFLWFDRDTIYEALGLDENGELPEEEREELKFDIGDPVIVCGTCDICNGETGVIVDITYDKDGNAEYEVEFDEDLENESYYDIFLIEA